MVRFWLVAWIIAGTFLLTVRADDPPKQQQPAASGLALSNQGLQQKQTQAETARLASRLDGMLRVLAYHQLEASAERKIMDEAAGALKGLSREQMQAILKQLDQAARSPSPVETDQHLDSAHEKHREVLDRLRLLITRFESMRSLEQAAQQIDKIAKEEVNLRERVQKADQQRREQPAVRRGMRPESPNSQALRQQDLARDTESVLQKLDELKGDVPEEMKPRIDRTLEIAKERQLLETMRDAANHIRYRNVREADDRQIQATSDLERLARTLRAPTEKLAALQEARERVEKLIPQQKALREEAGAAKDPRQRDASDARPNNREAEGNKQAARQTEMQVQTRDAKDLVRPHAADVAEKLAKAESSMGEAKDRLRNTQAQKAVEPQGKAVKNLEDAKQMLDKLVAEEEKRQRDPLVGLQKAVEDLEKLIAQEKQAQQQAKNAVQSQRPQDLKPQAPKQQNLAFKAEEIAQKPLAARPETKELIQNAAEAMHAASEQLHTQHGEPAIENQERALKGLAKARDALKEEAKAMEQRREQIAQMEKAGQKLDELHKQEKAIADKAQQQSESKDAKQANGELAKQQEATKGKTDELTKELKDLAPKAAEKTRDSSPTMQQAADALKQQQAQKGSEKADQAASQLADAKAALDEALAQKQAEEAAAEAMQNPDKVQPGEAAVHVAKALMETKEAARQAQQAAKKGEQSKQAMQKSQSATQSAQSALDQARALSPQNVMPPLDNARKDLEKAQQDLSKSSPQDAKSAQDQAAKQLNQALQSLQQTLQAMEKMQGNQQQSAQNDQKGQQQPGQKGQQQAKGQQKSQQKSEQTAQNQNDQQKQGDPTQNGERDGNAKAEKLDVRGSSTFVNLPPRQRELILQALSEKLPPEQAAQIQRYFESIAGGKPATEEKKKK